MRAAKLSYGGVLLRLLHVWQGSLQVDEGSVAFGWGSRNAFGLDGQGKFLVFTQVVYILPGCRWAVNHANITSEPKGPREMPIAGHRIAHVSGVWGIIYRPWLHAPKIRCIGIHGFEMRLSTLLMVIGIKCLYGIFMRIYVVGMYLHHKSCSSLNNEYLKLKFISSSTRLSVSP